MATQVAELRRRLDLDPAHTPDEVLQGCLDVAGGLLVEWFPPPGDVTPAQAPLVDEAVYQLAVKVFDLQARGTIGVDAVGGFVMPPPSATAGLVRSVWAFVAAVNPTGGVTV